MTTQIQATNFATSASAPMVVIILVNFNGADDTIECLHSLKKINYTNFRIVVVDNGSNTNEIPLISDIFPNVIYKRSDINTGFTGGNNIGLEMAYPLNPDFIFFLNNDTIVSENILKDLVAYMEANSGTGMAGPINCYYNQREIISFGGGFINRNNGLVKFVNKGVHIKEAEHSPLICSFIEGSAMLVRTVVVKKIGGFFDGYFLTSEESELCVRISDLDYNLAIIPNCVVWHKVSKSMGVESALSSYFIFRNKLWFIKRNAKKIRLKDLLFLFKYYLICFLSYSLKKRNYQASKGMIMGIMDFLKGIKGPGRFR